MTKTTEVKAIYLNRDEVERLRNEVSKIVYPKSGSYEAFVRESCDAVARSLDPETRDALLSIKNERLPEAPVVIKNLPYDPSVTRGMLNPEAAETGKPNDLSEGLLVGFVAQIGEPYAIKQEGLGLVSNLSPTRSHLKSHTGLGSINELGPHIENAAGRLLAGDRAPDGLALIGVSRERDVSPGTVVADGRKAVTLLSAADIIALKDREGYALKAPERWRTTDTDGEVRTAVMYGDDAYPTFVGALYGDMLRPLTGQAAAALEAFKAAIDIVAIDLKIEPGTLALIDNRVIWHGRRSFQPAFDGSGRPYRFLQRVFWTTSLRRFGDWKRERGRLITPSI